jgi:hypothetical protein
MNGAKVPLEDAYPSFNQMAAAGIKAALQKPPHGLPAPDNFSFANQQAEEVRYCSSHAQSTMPMQTFVNLLWLFVPALLHSILC